MNKLLSLSLLCVSSLIFSANEETCDSKYSGGWGIMRSMCRVSGTPQKFKKDATSFAIGAVAGSATVLVAPYAAPIVAAIAANPSAAATKAYNALNAAVSSTPTATKVVLSGAAASIGSSNEGTDDKTTRGFNAPAVEPIVSAEVANPHQETYSALNATIDHAKRLGKIAISGAANTIGSSKSVAHVMNDAEMSNSDRAKELANIAVNGVVFTASSGGAAIGFQKVVDVLKGGPAAREEEQRQLTEDRQKALEYAEQNLKVNAANLEIQENASKLHEEILKSEQNQKLNQKQKELALIKKEMASQSEKHAKTLARFGDKSINYRRSGDNELKRSIRAIQGLDEQKE